jgi:hypothetical protein
MPNVTVTATCSTLPCGNQHALHCAAAMQVSPGHDLALKQPAAALSYPLLLPHKHMHDNVAVVGCLQKPQWLPIKHHTVA